MQYLYPQTIGTFDTGQKLHWGSLRGSASALALIEFVKTKKQSVLLVAADIAQCGRWYQTLNFYNDNLSILSFDSWEVLAFDYFSPHPDIISNRLKTLSSLQNTTNNHIVITTIEALSQRICPVEFVQKHSFQLGVNDSIDSNKFGEKLTKIGYNRVATVLQNGEFNIKGSLIDLFPMGAKSPYRLDLFDTNIESIRTFDPSTQRSVDTTEQIALLPAKEFATDAFSITTFCDNYQQTFGNSDDFITTEVAQGHLPAGIEFYLPLFFKKTGSLFDYLPPDLVIATETKFATLLNDNYRNINARFTTMAINLDRPPLAVERVFLSADELLTRFKSKTRLVIKTAQLTPNQNGINFKNKPLPLLLIDAKQQNPLAKLLNFINRFTGKILLVCESQSRQNVLLELLFNHQKTAHKVADWHAFTQTNNTLNISIGNLNDGLFSDDIAVISENNLFGTEVVKQKRRRRAKHQDFDEAIKSLVEIEIGDPIVHENYGVGRYLGLEVRTFDSQSQDFLSLKYANDAKLMVPITSLNLISRYLGASADNAPLHKLGTNQWAKAKQKASESLYDVAAQLLEISAKRATETGFAFPAPNDAYTSFVAGFSFEETEDQLKTMTEVLTDMQASKPMDRLVCGDVGFGKTEIAMRAAFLATEADKQVIMLVPTTLLTNQHYQSFADRFSQNQVKIAALSRFQTSSQQQKIKAELGVGKINIVIGTHKLLRSSIKYHNLGLIIIDEEHRFGVKQKEMLKKLRGQCDILTMTATPIPRTLNMALSELREISIIATPPQGRNAIHTFVNEWNNAIIKEACLRELHRGGQIFMLHNDIDSIDNIADLLQQIIPNMSVRIAHGQMPTRELENIMRDFYHQRFQLLVCTTIIETGIDIPNANTIIINNAQNFGLAQLHQLRGRVGRSHHQAYAYLMIKSYQSLRENAKKRLDTIASLDYLGAGFMLANHDLEIRGAGDLLGDNQSGKISEIGFNLYHDLLKRTILAMKKGVEIKSDTPIHQEIQIDSGIACIIPQTYLFDVYNRLVFYKRIASAENEAQLKELEIELIDRFGQLPDATKNLFALTILKLLCEKIGVDKISIFDDFALINFTDNTPIKPLKIINLIQQQAKIYQLKKQNQLCFKQDMPPNIERIYKVEKLLSDLNGDSN